MKFSSITALICAGIMAFTPVCITTSAESADMRDMTTMEIVRDMGVGINLGNTFESCGDWIAQGGCHMQKSYRTNERYSQSPEVNKKRLRRRELQCDICQSCMNRCDNKQPCNESCTYCECQTN